MRCFGTLSSSTRGWEEVGAALGGHQPLAFCVSSAVGKDILSADVSSRTSSPTPSSSSHPSEKQSCHV